jgi:CBS domain-containing protein
LGSLDTPIHALRHRLTIRPTVVRADASLESVAEAVRQNPAARVIGVIDEQARLMGVIPVRAVVEHLLWVDAAAIVLGPAPTMTQSLTLARALSAQQAQDLMQPPLSVAASGTVGEALRLMQRRGLTGLPITDEQGRVVNYVDPLELLLAQRHGSG